MIIKTSLGEIGIRFINFCNRKMNQQKPKNHCLVDTCIKRLKCIDALPTPQRTQMWAQIAAEEEGVGARSLAHNTWGVEGRVGAPGWD